MEREHKAPLLAVVLTQFKVWDLPYIDAHLFFAQFFQNMACRQHPPGPRNHLLSSFASDPEGVQRNYKGPVKSCSTDPLAHLFRNHSSLHL